MKAFFVLLKRELATFFYSPLAYSMMMFFLFVMGYSFWVLVARLTHGVVSIQDVSGDLFSGGLFWMSCVVLAPLLCMRSFAEEKRSGTIELLMTAPISDWAVVMAKFAAAFLIYSVMWLLSGVHILILRAVGVAIHDVGTLASGYLGVMLIGLFYVSIGVFCSAVSRSPLVAAMSSFALIVVSFVLGTLQFTVSYPLLLNMSQYVSSFMHMQNFSRGIVDSRAVVYYVSMTWFFLFATVKVIEARRWK